MDERPSDEHWLNRRTIRLALAGLVAVVLGLVVPLVALSLLQDRAQPRPERPQVQRPQGPNTPSDPRPIERAR